MRSPRGRPPVSNTHNRSHEKFHKNKYSVECVKSSWGGGGGGDGGGGGGGDGGGGGGDGGGGGEKRGGFIKPKLKPRKVEAKPRKIGKTILPSHLPEKALEMLARKGLIPKARVKHKKI